VDTRTGTLAVQLEVANPQRLLHGQFARVQVPAIVYLLREVTPHQRITRGSSGYRAKACDCWVTFWVTQKSHRAKPLMAEGFGV
jgi:hypothetical protein